MVCKSNHGKGQDRADYHHFFNGYTHLSNGGVFSTAALGSSRREEDQISCGSAGGNPDEEAGDKAASF